MFGPVNLNIMKTIRITMTALTAPLTDEELKSTAIEFAKLSTQIEHLTDQADALKDMIVSRFPEEAGEQTEIIDDVIVSIKRQERWTWNSEELEKIFADKSLPPYANRRYSLEKRKFQNLNPDEQKDFLHALTRRPGNATVNVTQVEND